MVSSGLVIIFINLLILLGGIGVSFVYPNFFRFLTPGEKMRGYMKCMDDESSSNSNSSMIYLMPDTVRHHLHLVLEQLDCLNFFENPCFDQKGCTSLIPDIETWDLLWSFEVPPWGLLESTPFKDYNRVNHIPNLGKICSKVTLWKTFSNLKLEFGAHIFNFLPQHILKGDKVVITLEDEKKHWLVKKTTHRGVHVFNGLSRAISRMNALKPVPSPVPSIMADYMVTEYISPLLINNQKWDLGIYVFISSLEPLRVYVYDNALIRMCKLPHPSPLTSSSPKEAYVIDDYLPPFDNPLLAPYYSEIPTEFSEGTSHLSAMGSYLTDRGIIPSPQHFTSSLHRFLLFFINQSFLTTSLSKKGNHESYNGNYG